MTTHKTTMIKKPVPKKQTSDFKSRLSFQPLFDTWRKRIKDHRKGSPSLYEEILERVSRYPELLQPIDDIRIVEKHEALLEAMMATVFPVTLSDKEDLFAIAVPFTYQVIYASRHFREIFIDNKGEINIGDDETSKKIIHEKECGAYQLILNKFYKTRLPGYSLSVHAYRHPVTGLERFSELKLDARFVDVKAKGKLPELPPSLLLGCNADTVAIDELKQCLPLSMFEFEGMMLVNVRDVTEQQIISEIKNSLITVNAFTEVESFKNLQAQIQNLIGLHGLEIGITPFFTINGHFVFPPIFENLSLLFPKGSAREEKNQQYLDLSRHFLKGVNLLLVPKITEAAIKEYPFLQHIRSQHGNSIIICPLINENQLIGTLEIVSKNPGHLTEDLLVKLSPVLPLFTLALEKSAKDIEARIDAVIKEQFTAVQSSVEWRFTEVAINYISQKQVDEEARIENIVFENVYPLYGAIDIRNSSGERNEAIQKDLSQQLEAALNIMNKAAEKLHSPLLNTLSERTSAYIKAIGVNMHSDDEFEIHGFLKKEVKELLQHLRHRVPAIQPDINEYFDSIDSDTKTWNLHRKEFEESITFINNTIARFIDREEARAQQLYPHYFERFVTDGIDFNMYVGKSISPQQTFTPEDLRQLKIWELTTLTRAAVLAKRIERKVPVPLQTTQLILAHNQPISISFRVAERKFDVDGAYNIRYEIIKKRIDKVHIKDGERLTQPGMLAIVYTQPDEAAEYRELIGSLQKEGLLEKEIQEFELEELQGVSGLKALRVAVNMEDAVPAAYRNEKK